MPEIITREEAIARGLTRYFTGEPCAQGHIAERHVVAGRCHECVLKYRALYRDSGKAAKWTRKYQASAKGKVVQDRYRSSERAKQLRKEYQEAYAATEHGRAIKRNYKRSDKYRTWARAYAATPEVKEKVAAYRKTESGKDVDRRGRRKYRNSEHGRITRNALREARRAREKGAAGTFSTTEAKKLIARQKRCYICGKRFTKDDPPTFDHVIALVNGGTHDPGNIALAHRGCNYAKQARRTHLL